jgi:hypothetical protein
MFLQGMNKSRTSTSMFIKTKSLEVLGNFLVGLLRRCNGVPVGVSGSHTEAAANNRRATRTSLSRFERIVGRRGLQGAACAASSSCTGAFQPVSSAIFESVSNDDNSNSNHRWSSHAFSDILTPPKVAFAANSRSRSAGSAECSPAKSETTRQSARHTLTCHPQGVFPVLLPVLGVDGVSGSCLGGNGGG